jgi:hypothetical protein
MILRLNERGDPGDDESRAAEHSQHEKRIAPSADAPNG